jgi:HSP20 family protein
VIENEHGYTVRVAAPGLTADNFEITLHQNVLTLRTRIQEPAQEGAHFLVRELRYGEFTRTLQFPSQVNSENVVANLANGLLTIEVPKAEAAKTRKIAISAN